MHMGWRTAEPGEPRAAGSRGDRPALPAAGAAIGAGDLRSEGTLRRCSSVGLAPHHPPLSTGRAARGLGPGGDSRGPKRGESGAERGGSREGEQTAGLASQVRGFRERKVHGDRECGVHTLGIIDLCSILFFKLFVYCH